jgi:hypothetical protein
MRNRWWQLLLIAALALGLAACSSNPPASTSGETGEAPSVAGPQASGPEEMASTAGEADAAPSVPLPEIAAPVETVIPEAVPPTPESAFTDALVALEKLDSYRYTTSFVFVGEEDGETESGSMELTGVIAGPDRMHLVMRNVYEDESFEVIRIGSEAWILDDEGWSRVPVLVANAMTEAALVFAPSVAWNGLLGELQPDASYVGKDVVNRVPADHYTATYTQWGGYWPGELIDATGDVWIAEAGYPVRYHFSATGIDEDGDRGAVTWAMDLTDVNAPLTIEPPM